MQHVDLSLFAFARTHIISFLPIRLQRYEKNSYCVSSSGFSIFSVGAESWCAALRGSHPWRRSASAMIHCICPLTERNSCAAQRSTSSIVCGSSLSRNPLLCCLAMRLLVECACVQYRLGGFVGAEHHQQVAYHRGLAFLVKGHNLLLAELVESHLHHRNSTFNNLFTS